MSATIVQSLPFNDGTAHNPSVTFTLPQATVAGNALIAVAACVTKTRTITGLVDSASNGWVQIDGGGASGEGFCDIWWVPSAASITSFHLTYSGTTKLDLTFYEVSGLAGTVNAHHTTPHTTAATTANESVTTTGSGDTFLLAAMGAGSSATGISGAITTLDGGAGGAGLNVSAGHAEVTGAGTYSVTFSSTSQVSRTTMIALDVTPTGGGTVSGTASNVTSAPGAATGVASNHRFSGTANSPVAAPGAASGVASNHTFHGTASGLVPALGAATGNPRNHVFSGSGSSPVAAVGSAVGVASPHAIHGTASGPTGSSGAAVGAASTHTVHGTAGGAVAAPGAAVGVASAHAIHGQGAGPAGTSGSAVGVASTHTVHGTASGDVTTIGAAVGHIPGGTRSAYRRRPRPSVQ